MTHALLDQVAQCLSEHSLLPEQGIIYIAISGGADSVALLMAMRRLGYKERLCALHCNFHLRGAESDEDERFVQSLCARLGIACRITHFDTMGYAHSKGISIEMAARELRYRWFAEQRTASGDSTVVVVAHNAQDQVETLLLNLSMGTGIRGLSGMPYQRVADGIIRPLLDCSRELILDYLATEGQSYRTDSSNADTRYKRNLIRHELIPLFQQLNPSFLSSTRHTMEHLRSVEGYYLDQVAQRSALVWRDQGIHITSLQAQPHYDTLLFELLSPYGFTPDTIQGVLQQLTQGTAGAHFYSPTHRLIRGQNYLELAELSAEEEWTALIDIRTNGSCELPQGKSLSWSIEERPSEVATLFPLAPDEALFDYEALACTELLLRGRREGDALYPFGMKGRKLLRRIFIDGKYSHAERRAALLLCRGDEVLWLLGRLADRRYRISEATQQMIRFRLS